MAVTPPSKIQVAFTAAITALIGLGVALGYGVSVVGGNPVVTPTPTVTPSPTVTPTPTPTPVPTTAPPPAPATSVSFRVTVWNEKSYPALTKAQYVHDLLSPQSATGWAKAPALAYLGSEFQPTTGEQQLAAQYAAAHGMTQITDYADTPNLKEDTLLQFKNESYLTLYTSKAVVFHGPGAGPASPSRRYVATWADVNGFRVVFVSVHLTNGCIARNKGKSWYENRCQAVQDEITYLTKNVVNYEHGNDWTVVIGGDMNTNALINWGAGQAAISPNDLMQLAVVPAAGVTASMSGLITVPRESDAGLWTDHLTSSAKFTLIKG